MQSGGEQERKNERARLQVDEAVRQLEVTTERTLRELRITQPVRNAADAAWRKARLLIGARRYPEAAALLRELEDRTGGHRVVREALARLDAGAKEEDAWRGN